MKALGTALACLLLCRRHESSKDSSFREMAVRFHNERDKRHPKRVRCSEYLLQDEEIADDSLVITVCYEAHAKDYTDILCRFRARADMATEASTAGFFAARGILPALSSRTR
jgi:hypothetical protein